jgi:hypothetical protein
LQVGEDLLCRLDERNLFDYADVVDRAPDRAQRFGGRTLRNEGTIYCADRRPANDIECFVLRVQLGDHSGFVRSARAAAAKHQRGSVRLIERWLPIAELGEENDRERRSMTALPPVCYLHV